MANSLKNSPVIPRMKAFSFQFPWRKRPPQGSTGLCLCPGGVAVARLLNLDGAEKPRLSIGEFTPFGDDEPAKVLAEVARLQGLERADCTSVMNAGALSLFLIEAPQVEPDELKAAVRWRVKDLINFPIDDAVLDVFDIPGQQARGRPGLMYVVVARRDAVRAHIDLLEGSGIGLAAIDIPELVQRNLASLLPEDPSGVALLSLSEATGLLTLSRRDTLYLARGIDIGTNQLAAALDAGGEELSIDFDEPGLPTGVRRLLDGVVLEVQRSLDYYESHFSLPPIAGLVLAPLAVPIPGLLSHLAASLAVPVRTLDLNVLFETAAPLSDAEQARCLSAVGAALRQEAQAA